MPHIPEEAVADFKKIILQEYGVELTDEDARTKAEQFFTLFTVVTQK
jgi:hypothetical protein